jgi:hypothetical protein
MTRLSLLLLGSLLGACAPHIAMVPHAVDPVPLARGLVGEGQSDVVWAQAVRLLTARGFKFDACDDSRGALRTAPTEGDAPCGATTCLARQYVTVKVGGRAVRLSVRREVWDPTWRSWVPLLDQRSQDDVIRLERELLGELMEEANRWAGPPPWSARLPHCPRPGSCEPGQCDSGLASAEPAGLRGLAAVGLGELQRGSSVH